MKRFVVLILFCMVVLFLPTQAHAETSGTCGENVTWQMDLSTGVLTISGQGEMDAGYYAPWSNYSKVIKKIVIEEGVTTIGIQAFAHCKELKEVVLPKSVHTIGREAFFSCDNLTGIDLTHIEHIDQRAFGSSGLVEVKIPDAITTIRSSTFSSCSNLEKVVLPEGLKEIENDAFSDCRSLRSVHLPSSVREIEPYAFRSCGALTDLQLNDGLRIIQQSVFSMCSKLESVTIPDSVMYIDAHAFSDCKNLREVNLGAEVTQIDVSAFRGCQKLTAFTLSSENVDYSVHQGVLYSYDKSRLMIMPAGLTGEYEIPSGTTSIENEACYGSSLRIVTIPGSIKNLGDGVFEFCQSLETVILQEGVENLGTDTFSTSTLRRIVIPASVTKIPSDAFSYCYNLKEITFVGLPPQIADDAFYKVEANAYYPRHIEEWKTAIHRIGGDLEWVARCTDGESPGASEDKDPSCTESGISCAVVCKICGELIKEREVLPALGHEYGEWVELTPPTTEHEGLRERTCSRCGQVEQEALPKLPEETEPTETEPTETEPIETQPLKQEEQESSGGVKWGAVAIVAIVSIAVGLIAASLIFVCKKKKK